MIDEYLERISYRGSREPTLATLRALHERHMRSVPFENLDIHWKQPIVLDADRLIDKVVRGRRGGFCYELNGAFAALLTQLGFDVTMLDARVGREDGTFSDPFDHMALLVTLDDGTRWLTDVGFGDSFLLPLNLDERGEQHDPRGVFRIIDGFVVQMKRGDTWANEFAFTLDPHPLEDFAPRCDYQQYSPESSFTQKRVCTIATEWGRVTLANDKLIITRDGVRTETPVAPAEWEDVLLVHFGIRRGDARG